MAKTLVTSVLQGIKLVKAENGEILSKPFLDVCKLILPLIDPLLRHTQKIAAMASRTIDVGRNITILENKYNSNPAKYNYLYSMVQEEVDTKTSKAFSSCTNGLLWLTRAMDFVVELFRTLLEHPDFSMTNACTDAYSKTLYKCHGSAARTTFSIAVIAVPNRKKFMKKLGDDAVKVDIEQFVTTFSPLLQQNHEFLVSVGLDDLKGS